MEKYILILIALMSFGITKTSAANDIAQGQPGTVCVNGGEWYDETRCFDANDTEGINDYKWKHIMFNVKVFLTVIGSGIILVLTVKYLLDKETRL